MYSVCICSTIYGAEFHIWNRRCQYCRGNFALKKLKDELFSRGGLCFKRGIFRNNSVSLRSIEMVCLCYRHMSVSLTIKIDIWGHIDIFFFSQLGIYTNRFCAIRLFSDFALWFPLF